MVDESRYFDGESNLSTSRASRATVHGVVRSGEGSRRGAERVVVEPNPVPPWEWRHRKSREWHAYWLALARVASTCVTRSRTRIVGQNMSSSESASRSPSDTQKNGATCSNVIRMERRTFWHASVYHVPSLIPTIRPASPQNTATKAPKTIIGSMITS